MASTLDTLIGRVADEQLRSELQAAASDLRKLTDFGLVFESHIPETVRLPHHPIRRGVKATYRDGADSSIFEVVKVNGAKVTIRRVRSDDGSALSPEQRAEAKDETVALDALVAIAEFGDAIYPGLRHLGSVSRGGDRPAHAVINGENHHALEALQFTHAGRVDCIYIDPPYNSGARDWKYNNDYVDAEDGYRHSKWLAFMERRLRLAKNLLNPDDSVLICTIDEREVHRLALLLAQVFGGFRHQMVSITINPKGTARPNEFSRVDEFALFVLVGAAVVPDAPASGEAVDVRWRYLRRNDLESVRGTRPRQFYPIYVDQQTSLIAKIGDPLSPDSPLDAVPKVAGSVAVFPIREDGLQMEWGLTAPSLRRAVEAGFVHVTMGQNDNQPYIFSYLTAPNIKKIATGELTVTGTRSDGSKVVAIPSGKASRPTTVWRDRSHDAGAYGTSLLGAFVPGRRFPFPKSLYAVEDAIRFFVAGKPEAVVLDFFGGSGTTTHAVARLNRQDGGCRQSITVTNNEVGAVEAKALRARGIRPGDSEWEALGIFEHITRPRVTAAITGQTPDGNPIVGEYRFTDEFPMSDGLEENVEFFELTYLDAAQVEVSRAFAGIAPLLWLRAGGSGPIIEECVDSAGRRKPFAWTDRYGVLFNYDRWRSFVTKLPETATTAYVVTDSNTEYAHIAGELPGHLDVVRLYERYLTTFAINER